MNKKTCIGLLVLGVFSLLIYGYSRTRMMENMMNSSMQRHRFVMRSGVAEKYKDLKNPLISTASSIKEGKQLYETNCVSCHGASGKGDGEVGKNLNPQPANIASSSKMPIATDSYLFWTISEGGIPLELAMTPFKSILKEDDIWKIINYLREL